MQHHWFPITFRRRYLPFYLKNTLVILLTHVRTFSLRKQRRSVKSLKAFVHGVTLHFAWLLCDAVDAVVVVVVDDDVAVAVVVVFVVAVVVVKEDVKPFRTVKPHWTAAVCFSDLTNLNLIWQCEFRPQSIFPASSKNTPWVNFINFLLAAFRRTDPKRAKKIVRRSSFLRFWDLCA